MGDAQWTKFTWNIKNFSRLNTKKLYSEVFSAGGYNWRVLVYPEGNNDYLSIYLDAADSKSLPYGWKIVAKVIIKLINQTNKNKTMSKETRHIFKAYPNDWGFTLYIPLKELNDPIGGYVVDDTCIIEAEVAVDDAVIAIGDMKKETGIAIDDTCIIEAEVAVDDAVIAIGDMKKETGIAIDDTCIIEAEVAVDDVVIAIGDMKKETVTQNEASSKYGIPCVDDDSPLIGTKSRRSFIAASPTNIPNPSSTLKNRSNIANTLFQSFMSEFDSDIPTYEKFGKVMEDLRAMMYGGNMGDIFEEWRPHILEIEALLAEIEDMEQESKENREASLLEELPRILESLAQSEQVSKQAQDQMAASLSLLDAKRQELAELRLQLARLVSSERKIREVITVEESVHAKSTSEKAKAEEKIKSLKRQKTDVSKNIETVQAKAEARVAALAEKKVAVQEWFSNPFPTAKNP